MIDVAWLHVSINMKLDCNEKIAGNTESKKDQGSITPTTYQQNNQVGWTIHPLCFTRNVWDVKLKLFPTKLRQENPVYPSKKKFNNNSIRQ